METLPSFPRRSHSDERASIRPWVCTHGDNWPRSWDRRRQLQFGHGFAPMETVRRSWPRLRISLLQFGHGFAPMETNSLGERLRNFVPASIRPWVCTHGDSSTSGPLWHLARLQFGHGFAPMETTGSKPLRRQLSFNSAMGLHPWRPGKLS